MSLADMGIGGRFRDLLTHQHLCDEQDEPFNTTNPVRSCGTRLTLKDVHNPLDDLGYTHC